MKDEPELAAPGSNVDAAYSKVDGHSAANVCKSAPLAVVAKIQQKTIPDGQACAMQSQLQVTRNEHKMDLKAHGVSDSKSVTEAATSGIPNESAMPATGKRMVALLIKDVLGGRSDLRLQVAANLSVGELKGKLSMTYYDSPAPARQRIVCHGRCIKNDERVGSFLGSQHGAGLMTSREVVLFITIGHQ